MTFELDKYTEQATQNIHFELYSDNAAPKQ